MLGLLLKLSFELIIGLDLIVRTCKITNALLMHHYKSKSLFQRLLINKDAFMFLIDTTILIIVSLI